jgi:hypothetical protein
VRSSVGCLFTNQIASGTTEIIAFLKERKINFYCAHCKNSTYAGLHHANRISCGYGSNWTKNGVMLRPKHYNPDAGEIDSMNVSVAAAILILKLKTTRILNYRFLISEIKKKHNSKKQNMKTNYSPITVITTLFFRQITEPQVDLVNKP